MPSPRDKLQGYLSSECRKDNGLLKVLTDASSGGFNGDLAEATRALPFVKKSEKTKLNLLVSAVFSAVTREPAETREKVQNRMHRSLATLSTGMMPTDSDMEALTKLLGDDARRAEQEFAEMKGDREAAVRKIINTQYALEIAAALAGGADAAHDFYPLPADVNLKESFVPRFMSAKHFDTLKAEAKDVPSFAKGRVGHSKQRAFRERVEEVISQREIPKDELSAGRAMLKQRLPLYEKHAQDMREAADVAASLADFKAKGRGRGKDEEE